MSSPQFVLHLVFPVADLGKTERFYTTVLKQEPQRADDSAMYQVGETPLFFTRCRQVLSAKYREENVGLNPLAFGVVAVEALPSVRTRLDQTQVVHSGIRKDRYGQKDFIWLDDPDKVRSEFHFRPWS